MKKRNNKIRVLIFLSVLSLCICTLTPFAGAVLNNKGSISLHVADQTTKEPMENVAFYLYFVAEAYENGGSIGYSYKDAYKKLYINMDNIEDAYIAVHLMHYSRSNNIEFTKKMTDKNGNIVFDGLIPGVYLITPAENTEKYFIPSPFVVRIPFYDTDKQSISFDVAATPKMQALTPGDFDYTTHVTVKKVWDTSSEHPDEIYVSLLRDFVEVARVALNDDNGWSYRWDDLPAASVWTAVESEVPPGFEVSYDVSLNTVTILNESVPPEETTDTEETTYPEETTQPETPTQPEPPSEDDELADTGQLNWPVPVLSVAGLLLFSMGWALLNFGKKENSDSEYGEV